MNKQTKVLVCMPADQQGMVPVGSTYDRQCHHCGRKLVVAPTGVKALELHPEMVPLCGGCFMRYALDEMSEKERQELEFGLPDTAENMKREASNLVPNTWRGRN